MRRTVLIFMVAGPAIAGLPLYAFNIHAIPFAWLAGALPMSIAGVAYYFLAERVWRFHTATFPATTRKRYAFAILMGTLITAFAAYGTSALVISSLGWIDSYLLGSVNNSDSSNFAAGVMAFGRQVFLNPRLAITLGAAAGAGSAIACCLLDGAWREGRETAACDVDVASLRDMPTS